MCFTYVPAPAVAHAHMHAGAHTHSDILGLNPPYKMRKAFRKVKIVGEKGENILKVRAEIRQDTSDFPECH
jgi:hypothetical protein